MVARPLDALEGDLRQSFAICPVFPQNIQSLLSKQCFHSSAVSLPSLPNFEKMLDFGVEVLVDFPLDTLESLEELELFLEEEVDVEGLLEDLENVVTIFFLSHIFFLIAVVHRPYFHFAPLYEETDHYLLAFPSPSSPLVFPL